MLESEINTNESKKLRENIVFSKVMLAALKNKWTCSHLNPVGFTVMRLTCLLHWQNARK